MKTKEIAELLVKIRDGATGSEMQLGELLRLCMRLGKLLNNDELVDWARKESSGYSETDELPDYRMIPTEVRAKFFGPFGRVLDNALIPPSVIDEDLRERLKLYSVDLVQPVSELQQYARSDDGNHTFQMNWPADMIRYQQSREIYENFVLASAWKITTSQTFFGVIETIRTRVLDFVLQIETELGIDIDAPTKEAAAQKPAATTINNIFHNTIFGGNVAMSSAGNASVNTINVSVGNLEELKHYLESIGVTEAEVTELGKLLKAEPGITAGNFGPKVGKWLSKMAVAAVKGTLKVSRDIAVALLTRALMQYYGMPSDDSH